MYSLHPLTDKILYGETMNGSDDQIPLKNNLPTPNTGYKQSFESDDKIIGNERLPTMKERQSFSPIVPEKYSDHSSEDDVPGVRIKKKSKQLKISGMQIITFFQLFSLTRRLRHAPRPPCS